MHYLNIGTQQNYQGYYFHFLSSEKIAAAAVRNLILDAF